LLPLFRRSVAARLGLLAALGCLVAATLGNITTGLAFRAAFKALFAATCFGVQVTTSAALGATGKVGGATIAGAMCHRVGAKERAHQKNRTCKEFRKHEKVSCENSNEIMRFGSANGRGKIENRSKENSQWNCGRAID
jgi:hypothetical protein